MKYASSSLAVVLLLLSACDSTESDPPGPRLLPVEVGNEWVMLRTDSITTARTRIDTFRVESTVRINRQTFYVIENRDGQGFAPWSWERDSNLYAFHDDGVWRHTGAGQVIQVIRFPWAEGAEYEVKDGLFGKLADGSAVFSLEGVGEVPSIKFEHRYTEAFRPFISDSGRAFTNYPLSSEVVLSSFFSPQYGLLKLENIYVSPNTETEKSLVVGRVRWELREFIGSAE